MTNRSQKTAFLVYFFVMVCVVHSTQGAVCILGLFTAILILIQE